MTDYVKSITAVNGGENETKSSTQAIEYRINGRDLTIPVLDSIPDNIFSIVLDSTIPNTYSPVIYGVGADSPPIGTTIASSGTAEVPLPLTDGLLVGGIFHAAWIGTVPSVTFCGQDNWILRSKAGANNDEPVVDYFLQRQNGANVASIISSTGALGTYINDGLILQDTLAGPPTSARSAVTIMETRSTAKGVKIFPKMTTAQRTAMSPVAGDSGLYVEDTDLNELFRWNGTKWDKKVKFSYNVSALEWDSLGAASPGRVSAGTNAFNVSRQFNRNVYKSLQANMYLDPDIYTSGNDIEVTVTWRQDSITAPAETVIFGFAYISVVSTEATNGAPLVDQQTFVIPNAINQLIESKFTITGANLAAGDTVIGQFFRDGATDTYDDDALVYSVSLLEQI